MESLVYKKNLIKVSKHNKNMEGKLIFVNYNSVNPKI